MQLSDGIGLGSPTLATWAAWGAMAVLSLLAVARSPYLLLRGRFWAEEATVHFEHVATETGPAGLLFIHERAGYLNLHPNVSTWLAAQGPLSAAPLVTVWLSVAVVVAIMVVSLRWPSRLLCNGASRLVGAGLLVVGPVAFPEVWLNSINAQVYLGLLVLLIAFVPVVELSRTRWTSGMVMLVIGGLSGLYGAALAPLFWLDAWKKRTRRSLGFAAAITGAALLQFVLLVVNRSSGALGETRFDPPSMQKLYRSIGFHQFVALLWGHERGDELLRTGVSVGDHVFLIATAAAVVGLLVLSARASQNVRVYLQLAMAFVLVQIVVQLGSVGRPAGGRYTVVPVGILTLAVVHGLGAAGLTWQRVVGALTCVLILAGSLTAFRTYRADTLRCFSCPDWRVEVQQYEAGETDELQVWPYHTENPWVLQLPAVDAP